ncbi:hypothetical protein HDF16_004051 [Granulicella aggregans]|uniref:Uncharacterized protein n=1 Tax=Granulicella aggregans TaxID=474949 RepID=A0A7W8E4R5_9BACT|nr:hypothetical protein [Granulicella aggregans]MBB5059328.1 hypothetical protein [Granulicella aggregans]
MLESTPFRRSARLRDFLIYVGNEAILHGTDDLHEQQIGTAVFGRSPSYDTSQDNIVRVNAMELRKRIDLYFANEGQNEPVIFEIPRGSYSPIFRLRRDDAREVSPDREFAIDDHPVATPLPMGETLSPEVPAVTPSKLSLVARALQSPISGILAAIIVCLSVWLIAEIRINEKTQVQLHKWQSAPALRAFWGNFFGRNLPPEIVLADSSFGLAQDVLHKKLSLAEYLDYTYRAAQSPETLTNDAREQERKDLSAVFNHSSGSIGDFRVARRITELETGDDGTRLLFAREYAGHRLRWNNTIFVGSSRSNPWVELFEDRIAYHFKESADSTPSFVTVDSPVGNEQAQYPISSDSGTRTAYCVIVFLPNPTNTGSTLILSGTDSQATEAGGDFLTSEENLEKLQALFQQKTFPYFQILLRISRSNGTPLGSEIISYRIVKSSGHQH